ncbi:DUF4189 domain-containing protein [Rhodanobacter panaciterrae]|uniref:DUF4189 domain-containing protein n=1 Tax=Rhodanobacter panaciterrae TaxID=490572 RepID=UPI00167A6843|nr:DUF4189 domain-containing protein [Rhodanobacter panaciterrae]
MKFSRWLLIGLLLLLGNATHAEDGCPSGLIPASGTNINSCVPIPPGYYGNQQPAQPQPSTRPQWADRWGAIATDSMTGSLGAVTGMSSEAVAQQAALSDCTEKGGTRCKPQTSYRNGCAAMVIGDREFNVGSAATMSEAIQSGMKVCTDAGNTSCRVYYSACSLPVRIQ